MPPRALRRGALIFILFVVFVVAFLLHRSWFLIGLLFEDGGSDRISASDIPASDSNITLPQLIPKIIHQTYITEKVPDHWQASQQAVKDLHPDYEYMFWTDTTALQFIETEYPFFLETYTSYPHPIQRADALRYFLLHRYGGIYIDLDLLPYRSLTPLLSYPSIACLTSPTGISNDILGSTPQHPFFTLVIERLSEYNRNWGLPYITVMYSTGPLFLSVVWIEFLRRGVPGFGTAVPRVRLLPKDGTNGDSYGFFKNVQGGSWHGRDMDVIFWMGRHWFLVTLLGFVIGFAVVGVLWRALRACAGLWRRERWWDRIRAAGKLHELG